VIRKAKQINKFTPRHSITVTELQNTKGKKIKDNTKNEQKRKNIVYKDR
jgi:hypothetical protein